MREMIKVERLLDTLAYMHMQNIIAKRPLDLNVETINQCPLKCIFCCNRLYQREPIVMDNVLFENIIRQYCDMGGGSLGIGSMQSDFLSDPLLLERMEIIKKYKKKLWVYSTTPLISSKKYSDRELIYILSMFDCLQISVEGHDEESYKKMSGIDGFKIMKEQTARVKRIIDDNFLDTKVDLYFRTYQRKELIKSDLYSELGNMFNVYEIRNTFFSWFGTIKSEELPKGAKVVHKRNEKRKKNCAAANATLAVMADGKVVGCGCVDWLEKYVIGDCRKNSLSDIWNSSEAVAFRKAFSEGKLPVICRECALYTSTECMRNKSLINYKPQDGLYYLRYKMSLNDKR